MTTPHPYAHILRAIADGETIECRDYRQGWISCDAEAILRALGSPMRPAASSLRVMPRTITINGREVPEPLRVTPPDGTLYWTPNLLSEEGVDDYNWCDDGSDKFWLQCGLIHLTREAAQAHTEALLSFTKQP